MVGGFCGWAIADPPTGDQQEGNFYFNVVSGKWRWYHTGSWQDIPGGAAGAVTSVFTRTGDVIAQTGDYNPVEVGFSAYPIVNADIAANAGITSGKVVALVNLGTSVFSAYPLVPGTDVNHDSYASITGIVAQTTSNIFPTVLVNSLAYFIQLAGVITVGANPATLQLDVVAASTTGAVKAGSFIEAHTIA